MAKNAKDKKTNTTRWADLKKEKLSADKIKEIEKAARAEALTMELRELRDMAGVTQTQLAEISKIAQSEISKIEQRDDHLLSTLRRYVKGLGGEVEVVAVLGNKRVTLTGV